MLTGNEKAFAAGADIKEMRDRTHPEALMQDFIGARWETVLQVKKPVIAAVAGFALGGGCELAMMCDFILAADTAKFGQPEINLGIFPGAGGTQRLTRAVGKSKAMDMVLTARMMDAAEAERSNLVSRVFPADQLLPEALKIAERLAATVAGRAGDGQAGGEPRVRDHPASKASVTNATLSCRCSARPTRRRAWPRSWRSGSRRSSRGEHRGSNPSRLSGESVSPARMEHRADNSGVSRSGAAMAGPSPAAGMHPAELNAALTGAMIEARYQPIVRIADRMPIAIEALARLNHPTRGTLMPESFVPQIEESGLAAQLTELIVDRALADLASPLLAAETLRVTLNFPLDVLLLPEALQRLDARRQQAGIPANRIVIEMTESRPVEDLGALGAVLEKLRDGGYRTSIDDIIPGMPRLDELLQLPFGGVKFDRSVVQALDTSPAMLAFMRRVIATAQARGLAVVAEGVEDVPTWQRVAGLGVALAQGFLIARSMPADAVPGWLEAWRRQPGF